MTGSRPELSFHLFYVHWCFHWNKRKNDLKIKKIRCNETMHYGHSLWSRLEPQISHYYTVWWRLTNSYIWKQFKWFIRSHSADCSDLRIVHRHWRKCYSTPYTGIWLRNIWGKFLYNSCISVKKFLFFSCIFLWPSWEHWCEHFTSH